jgi:hypothetical protein
LSLLKKGLNTEKPGFFTPGRDSLMSEKPGFFQRTNPVLVGKEATGVLYVLGFMYVAEAVKESAPTQAELVEARFDRLRFRQAPVSTGSGFDRLNLRVRV